MRDLKRGREIASRFDAILETLLETTAASRVTLRIDLPEHDFGVNVPAAEARVPGVKSLMSESSLDQRAAATIEWLERERRILVQSDVLSDGPRPPQALIDIYGTRAQMLGPLFDGAHLAGWISVHQSGQAREWRASDVEALENALEAVREVLGEPEDRG